MKSKQVPRKYKDKEFFSLNSTTITAGSSYFFDLDDRYKPYDYALITNASSQDIKVITNFSQSQICNGNDNLIINRKISDHIQIINLGSSTINANEISITYLHQNKLPEQFTKASQFFPLVSLLK
jgi:hypothetical protein